MKIGDLIELDDPYQGRIKAELVSDMTSAERRSRPLSEGKAEHWFCTINGQSAFLKYYRTTYPGSRTWQYMDLNARSHRALDKSHPGTMPKLLAAGPVTGPNHGFVSVTEFIDAPDLNRYLLQLTGENPDLVSRLLLITRKLLRLALSFAEVRILLQDIKPENFLLVGDTRILMVDDESLLQMGPGGWAHQWQRTPGFHTPERVQTGRVDLADEVYAIGLTLGWLLETADGRCPKLPPERQKQLDGLLFGWWDRDPSKRLGIVQIDEALWDLIALDSSSEILSQNRALEPIPSVPSPSWKPRVPDTEPSPDCALIQPIQGMPPWDTEPQEGCFLGPVDPPDTELLSEFAMESSSTVDRPTEMSLVVAAVQTDAASPALIPEVANLDSGCSDVSGLLIRPIYDAPRKMHILSIYWRYAVAGHVEAVACFSNKPERLLAAVPAPTGRMRIESPMDKDLVGIQIAFAGPDGHSRQILKWVDSPEVLLFRSVAPDRSVLMVDGPASMELPDLIITDELGELPNRTASGPGMRPRVFLERKPEGRIRIVIPALGSLFGGQSCSEAILVGGAQ